VRGSLEILCPAKVNLHLRVLGRRGDGYHDIISLMQPIGLFDKISLSLRGEGIVLRCDRPDIPQDEGNLAWRAAELFRLKTARRFGLQIELEKVIPIGSGLGGGSSDAAGVLVGLTKLLSLPIPKTTLMEWAAQLGSDVPFFILGRPAWVTGRGERLKEASIQFNIWYVVAFPGFSVSTKWVYEEVDLRLTKSRKNFKIQCLIEDMGEILHLLHNDLESVTAKAYPWITRQKNRMMTLGAKGALMSGSGPAVFGVFDDFDSATSAMEALRMEGTEAWVAEGLK
jgi:4-diphosphocytidyl-2-C-methyl-D-erythritol kinase